MTNSRSQLRVGMTLISSSAGAIRVAPASSARRSQRQPGLAIGLHLGELLHRRMQRGRAPQQVEEDPAGVHPQLVVVGVVQREDAVDEVGAEQRDDARDQQVEGRAALAGVDGEADARGEQDDVAHRVADRDELRHQAERVIVDVGGDQEDPGDQRQAQRHDHRVDRPRAVGALVAPANQEHEADHQHRVDREVDRVAGRRERDVGAEQLRVAVGVEVAQPEQEQPERRSTTRPAARAAGGCECRRRSPSTP